MCASGYDTDCLLYRNVCCAVLIAALCIIGQSNFFYSFISPFGCSVYAHHNLGNLIVSIYVCCSFFLLSFASICSFPHTIAPSTFSSYFSDIQSDTHSYAHTNTHRHRAILHTSKRWMNHTHQYHMSVYKKERVQNISTEIHKHANP